MAHGQLSPPEGEGGGSMTLIRVEDVSKQFGRSRDGVEALRDVSLSLEEGSFTTILGPSGCGKSTLLRLAAGLSQPTSGRVTLDGREILEPNPRTGMVFQQPVLLRWRNVLRNVLLPAEILDLNSRELRGRALELLEMAGLTGFENRMPYELSGGMQQRVALCRALVFNPDVLLMDEPFGALDALTREEMCLELLRIWEVERKTVLFVTHDIAEAIMLADQVVVMTPRPGKIAQIVDVGLPRPRDASVQYSAQFQQLAERLRRLVGTRHAPDVSRTAAAEVAP